MLKQWLSIVLLLAISACSARAAVPAWLTQTLTKPISTTPMVWGTLHRSELPPGISLSQWQQGLPCDQRFEVIADNFWLCQYQQQWWGFQFTHGALWLTAFHGSMLGKTTESGHLSELSKAQVGPAGLVISMRQQSLKLTEKFLRFRYAARLELVERISSDHVMLWLSRPQQLLILTSMQQQTLILALNHDT